MINFNKILKEDLEKKIKAAKEKKKKETPNAPDDAIDQDPLANNEFGDE